MCLGAPGFAGLRSFGSRAFGLYRFRSFRFFCAGLGVWGLGWVFLAAPVLARCNGVVLL